MGPCLDEDYAKFVRPRYSDAHIVIRKFLQIIDGENNSVKKEEMHELFNSFENPYREGILQFEQLTATGMKLPTFNIGTRSVNGAKIVTLQVRPDVMSVFSQNIYPDEEIEVFGDTQKFESDLVVALNNINTELQKID